MALKRALFGSIWISPSSGGPKLLGLRRDNLFRQHGGIDFGVEDIGIPTGHFTAVALVPAGVWLACGVGKINLVIGNGI